MRRARRPGLFVLTAVCTLAFVLAVIPRTATPAKADDSQNVTIPEAMAQAHQSGQPVLATAETTESSSVVANPDGTLTATLGAGPLQEPDPDSPTGWSPIDLTLQHEDGTFTPAVSAADTSFSDGGSGALATLADGSRTYTENWPTSLPTPEVSGEVATYPDVLPGIDLVMQAQTAGFKQNFLIHSAPDQPLVLDVPLSLRGLNASVDDQGNLVVTDTHGNTVATSGTAVMYGAATNPSGEPTISESVDTAIVNVGGTPVFRITPDQSFFANPELTYPVTIDPSPNLDVSTDAYVRQSTPDTSYLTENGLKVGLVATGDIARALLKFPALDPTYRGNSNAIDVSSATLNLYEVDSGDCTNREIDLYEANQNWITAGGPTWSNQPTIGTMYASASFTGGHSGCSAGARTISTGGASGYSLKDLVQNWADGSTNNGFELKAADESTTNAYKKFRSSEYGSNPPTLSVTYNTLPDVPTNFSEDNSETSQPTLHATFSDPDGGTGSVQYALYDVDSNILLTASGSTVTSGNDSPLTIPSGYLTNGEVYQWYARGTDGTDTSAYSDVNSPWWEDAAYTYAEEYLPGDPGYVAPSDLDGVDWDSSPDSYCPGGYGPIEADLWKENVFHYKLVEFIQWGWWNGTGPGGHITCWAHPYYTHVGTLALLWSDHGWAWRNVTGGINQTSGHIDSSREYDYCLVVCAHYYADVANPGQDVYPGGGWHNHFYWG